MKNILGNKKDFAHEIQILIQNLSVITRYNGETNFTIDSICLDKSPRDVFEVRVKKGSRQLKKKEARKMLQVNNPNDPNSDKDENKEKSANVSKTDPEFEIRTYSMSIIMLRNMEKRLNQISRC